MANTDIEILHDVEAIPPEDWNLLAAGKSPFVSFGWLLANQRSLPCTPYFVVTRERGRVVGITPFLHVTSSTYKFFVPTRLLAEVLRRVPDDVDLSEADTAEINQLADDVETTDECDALVAAIPFGYTSPFALTKNDTFDSVMEAAEDLAHQLGIYTCACLYLAETDTHILDSLARRGYMTATLDADFVINIAPEWSSLDDYFGICRKSNTDIRRERRVFREAEIAVEWHKSLDANLISRLVEVETHFLKGKGHRFSGDDIRKNYEALLTAVPESLLAVTGTHSTLDLEAFVLFLHSDQELISKRFGMKSTREFVYFNIGYYEPVAYAINHGYRTLRLGPSTAGAKLHRGAKPDLLFGAFNFPKEHRLIMLWPRISEALGSRFSS